MSAVKYDGWEIVTGQDFRQKIILRDTTKPKIKNPNYSSCNPDSKEYIYPPKDLTDCTGKMDIRVANDSTSELIISLETGAGMTFGSPDPIDGTIELFIDNTVTAGFIPYKGRVYFDLFFTPPSPQDNMRIIYGQILIIEAVTDVN